MIRALIFDFDGVILDSVDIKTRAFARLFETHGEDVVREVVEHHLAHGGVSRFRKFRHIHEHILRRTLSEAESEQLGERFNGLVFEEVVKAAWIPGAPEFLREHSARYRCFVASGTPQEELVRIVELRDLTPHFAGVFGSPPTKEEIARRILAENALTPGEVIFIGDAMTDHDAARACGLRFIGIAANGCGPFPAGVTVLPDLRSLAAALM
jgi:HAD superfamily hydrolase (TIGR01549 family)